MTPAQQYARWVREARLARNQLEAEAVRRLERRLAQAAAEVRQAIRDTPRGMLGERFRLQLLSSLSATLERFRADYAAQLDQDIMASARIVEAREQRVAEALARERLAAGEPADAALDAYRASFGQVPRDVLERLYARVYPDGLRLSDRLHGLTLETRRLVADQVTDAVATGRSARETARRIVPLITPPEGAPPGATLRYRAQRIAVTEINNAYREGHVAASTDGRGALHPWIAAIGWRLSLSHPAVDICDWWAGHDGEGLGPGNYSPANVPVGHPRCRCYLVNVLVARPGEQYQTYRPRPKDVPESQLRYYGVSTKA